MQDDDPLSHDPTLANRFLAHQLSAAELETLEAGLTSNANVAKELEATARFKVGLQKLRETGELEELLQPGSSHLAPWLALAATLIVAVGAFLVWRSLQPPPLLAATVEKLYNGKDALLPGSRTYVMFRRRATEDSVEVQLPATRQAIRLRVRPRLGSQPPYRVTLARALGRGRLLASIEAATPDADGFVTVFADSQRLEVGSYLLVVSEASQAEGAQDEFSIEVVATAAGQQRP